MDQAIHLNTDKLPESGCLTLIGMAGAGKSTVGELLAREMSWGHLDTDRFIESFYGAPLQDIYDAFGLERFKDLEGNIISLLNAKRCIVSTGGSVIYTEKAMARLSALGPIIHLDLAFGALESRLTVDGRGLCIANGQSVEDLFKERRPLYRKAADFTVDTGELSPAETVRAITNWLTT